MSLSCDKLSYVWIWHTWIHNSLFVRTGYSSMIRTKLPKIYIFLFIALGSLANFFKRKKNRYLTVDLTLIELQDYIPTESNFKHSEDAATVLVKRLEWRQWQSGWIQEALLYWHSGKMTRNWLAFREETCQGWLWRF